MVAAEGLKVIFILYFSRIKKIEFHFSSQLDCRRWGRLWNCFRRWSPRSQPSLPPPVLLTKMAFVDTNSFWINWQFWHMWSHVQDLCRVVLNLVTVLFCLWNCVEIEVVAEGAPLWHFSSWLNWGPSSHTWLKRFPFKMFIHGLDRFKLFFLSVFVSAIIATMIKVLNVRSYATLIGGLGI